MHSVVFNIPVWLHCSTIRHCQHFYAKAIQQGSTNHSFKVGHKKLVPIVEHAQDVAQLQLVLDKNLISTNWEYSFLDLSRPMYCGRSCEMGNSELMRLSLLSNTSLRSISGGAMTRSHCTRSQGRGVVLRMQIFFFLMVLFCYTSTSCTCALFSHTRTNYLAVQWTNNKAEVCITCVLPLQDYLALSDFGPGSHFGCCFPRVAFKDEKVTHWSKVTTRYTH